MVQVMLPGWEVVTGTHVEVNECLDTENIPVCLQNGHQMWLSCCLGTLPSPWHHPQPAHKPREKGFVQTANHRN